MYVIPRDGYTIRDPDLRDILPAAGRDVPESSYWNRLVQFGDVSLGTPPAVEAAPSVTGRAPKSPPAERAESSAPSK